MPVKPHGNPHLSVMLGLHCLPSQTSAQLHPHQVTTMAAGSSARAPVMTRAAPWCSRLWTGGSQLARQQYMGNAPLEQLCHLRLPRSHHCGGACWLRLLLHVCGQHESAFTASLTTSNRSPRACIPQCSAARASMQTPTLIAAGAVSPCGEAGAHSSATWKPCVATSQWKGFQQMLRPGMLLFAACDSGNSNFCCPCSLTKLIPLHDLAACLDP